MTLLVAASVLFPPSPGALMSSVMLLLLLMEVDDEFGFARVLCPDIVAPFELAFDSDLLIAACSMIANEG